MLEYVLKIKGKCRISGCKQWNKYCVRRYKWNIKYKLN